MISFRNGKECRIDALHKNMEFKNRFNINTAQKSIQSSLNLTEDRIVSNERLLIAMGCSLAY